MSTTSDRGFWVTNHLANPILRPLLRGPVGHRLGRRLAVLRYRGRRTGQPHELVVQYVRDHDRLWIVPGQPERKRWWRNMLEAQRVDVWLTGRHSTGVARVLREGPDADELAPALAAYRVVFPKTAHAGVMVRVDLRQTSPAQTTEPETTTEAHPEPGSR